MTATLACACWSCDAQCGGDTSEGSCGPAVMIAGHPICEACASKADVFDQDRTGASATLCSERVLLRVNVFDSFRAANIYLDPENARILADKLLRLADELEETGR